MKPVFFTLVLLSSLARAQQAAGGVAEVTNPRVQEHRVGPEEALRRNQQEMAELQQDSFGFAHRTSQCSFEVVVTADGFVQSLEPEEVDPYCAPHLRDAEQILRDRVYKPWLIDGVPSKVRIVDWVNIYPPERRGPSVPFPARVDRGSLEFELERNGCFGSCPSYTVSVSGAGLVQFDGRELVAVPGHHSARVSGYAVTDLLARFRSADFLSALPEYKGNWTGKQTQQLTLKINGQTRTVIDYAGFDEGLPLAVKQLEDAIDNTAGTERWVKGNEGTVASLSSEHWNFAASTAENSALFRAAIQRNNTDLIAAFLRAKAPVVAAFDKAGPPLCEAGRVGNLALVKDMLQDVKQVPAPVMNRCLADAAESGRVELVQFWLDRGADAGAVANNGDTALKRDAQQDCKACAALIQDALNKKNGTGDQ